jgi:anti-sigma regulatory factor (Ser/Thr protein kinase)
LPTAETLDLVLTADWVAPSIVRSRLRTWLTAHRWPAAHIDDLVLAVNEAVSNSIEHGYGIRADHVVPNTDTVEIHGRIKVASDGYRHAEFTIADHGGWRAPTDARTTRGHGMLIMRTCADQVLIDFSDTGTRIELRSRPVPPAPAFG